MERIDIGNVKPCARSYEAGPVCFRANESAKVLGLASYSAVGDLTPPIPVARLRRRGDRRARACDFDCSCSSDSAAERAIRFDLRANRQLAAQRDIATSVDLEDYSRRSRRAKLTIPYLPRIAAAFMAAPVDERRAKAAPLDAAARTTARTLP